MTRRRHRITALALMALALLVSCEGDDTPAWVPDGYPPCVHEDSPGPCYWDAEHMGNGQGTSFVVTPDQTVEHIDH